MAQRLGKFRHALRFGLPRNTVSSTLGTSGTSSALFRTALSSVSATDHALVPPQIRRQSSAAQSVQSQEQDQYIVPAVTDSNSAIDKADPTVRPGAALPRLPHSRPDSPTHHGRTPQEDDEVPYWTHVPQWDSITSKEFISNSFQIRNTVKSAGDLQRFLLTVLPERLPTSKNPVLKHLKTRDEFIRDARAGLEIASMEVRLTPEILSLVDWTSPLDDPIRMQFITLKSSMLPDHPALTLDSLGEKDDSPVPGLVHRYPGRALFLATSNCPVYCRYCTRAYMVGPATGSTQKLPQKPSRSRWEVMFRHIEQHSDIQDIVVSGGDVYQLPPDQLRLIGERLLSIPHIRRFRIASKGLSVNPGRIIDPADSWGNTLIDLSNQGRKVGKQVCWHTHFNHPKEVTWIVKKAAHHLFKNGVIVRNQSVLQRGVNNDPATMSALIKSLADINIQPYYVYQHDLTRSVEDLRTPLQDILMLDKHLRGTLSGFMMPAFVVDLPGGGGKRLASTYNHYDPATGESTWSAPGLPGAKGIRKYTYWDPRPLPATVEELQQLRVQQDLMHKHKSTQPKDFMRDHEGADAVGQADHQVSAAASELDRAADTKGQRAHASAYPKRTFPMTFAPISQPSDHISLGTAPPSDHFSK
ncbi:kama family protein [Karstenula rhodostoma CBS 690.94]|uniref:Kama family protein n=1 Tax=Karstenula rhodostoma CBS 690.94 TaxID=1392251 RepID=A0A9P4UES4_9PLEO|nr:kama family protein [Karstenula rhodostoma CBS 690.94]